MCENMRENYLYFLILQLLAIPFIPYRAYERPYLVIRVSSPFFVLPLARKGWSTVAPYLVETGTTACAGTAQILPCSLLSSCPDAVTGVAGCWIVSLSRARACRREALPFLLPLPPNHVPRRPRRRRRRRCRYYHSRRR